MQDSAYPMDSFVSAEYTGGIAIRADQEGSCSPYGNFTDGPNTLDSVLIDSNKVHDIFGDGITFNTNPNYRLNPIFGFLNTHVRITGDTIYRTAVDGIFFGGTDSTIVSGNIVDSAGYGSQDTAHYASNGYTILSGSRRTGGCVGIWFGCQKNAIVQYNAISNTQQAHPPWNDAEAIDYDQNDGVPSLAQGHVYVQYNYSCNNQNGFFATGDIPSAPTTQDTSAIVRYNISQNDGMGQLRPDTTRPSPICYYRGGLLMYNNVFYNDSGIRLRIFKEDGLPQQQTSYFENNIFISNTKGPVCFTFDTSSLLPTVFSHNCYYDLANSSATVQSTNDPAPILANPNIKNPGKAVGGFLVNGGDSNEIASAQACYPLKQPTPCFETGIPLNNMGTFYDFWGTKVSGFPCPDVGAYQTPTTDTQKVQLVLDGTTAIISLNVIPYQNNDSLVFGNDNNDTNFYVHDSIPGTGYMYWPHKKINTFPNHQLPVGLGYTVYSDRLDTMKVYGQPVDYANTPIKLYGNNFWNQIAYLPQQDDSIDHALASMSRGGFCIVEDMAGDVFEPADTADGWVAVFGGLYVMHAGEGYSVRVSDTLTFTYPTPDTGVAKRVASKSGKPTLCLPKPRHYAIHAPTGCNDVILPKQVTIGGKLVPDLSEIGAFDASGSLVGSGTILKGVAAFVIWGQNPMIKQKDGLATGEPVTFKLWDGNSEYPLEFQSQNGTGVAYKAGAIFQGQMIVSGSGLIKAFDLTQAYPNPFRGSVKISFDVPTIAGASQQAIEINVYDLKGSLVKQLASGKYQAGHYTVAWNCSEGREASMGSSVYIVRMKATNFDKRLKLLRVQ